MTITFRTRIALIARKVGRTLDHYTRMQARVDNFH